MFLQKAQEELYSSSKQLQKKQAELSNEFCLYDTHSNLQRAATPNRREDFSQEFTYSEKKWVYEIAWVNLKTHHTLCEEDIHICLSLSIQVK